MVEGLRPGPVTQAKEKSTEITLSPVTKWKTMAVKERDPCTSEPTANTVKSKKKIKESEPAMTKPNTVIQTEKGKDPREVAKVKSKPVANMTGSKKVIEPMHTALFLQIRFTGK
jgi:hypothetical protein